MIVSILDMSKYRAGWEKNDGRAYNFGSTLLLSSSRSTRLETFFTIMFMAGNYEKQLI